MMAAFPIVIIFSTKKLIRKTVKKQLEDPRFSELQESNYVHRTTASPEKLIDFHLFLSEHLEGTVLHKWLNKNDLWKKMGAYSSAKIFYIFLLLIMFSLISPFAEFINNIRSNTTGAVFLVLFFCVYAILGYRGYSIILMLFSLSRKVQNYAVLILRVYNNSLSGTLFNSFTRKWKLIGNRIFISDQTYINASAQDEVQINPFLTALDPLSASQTDQNVVSYTKGILLTIFVFLLTSIVFYLLLLDYEKIGFYVRWITFFVIEFAFAVLLLKIIHKIVKRKVMRVFDNTEFELEKFTQSCIRNHKTLFHVYKDVSFYCRSHVWKKVFDRLLQKSRFVLMDLRSFTKERKGCLYEISKLVQDFDPNRTLYIIDENTDSDFLRSVISSFYAYKNTGPVKIYMFKSEANSYIRSSIRTAGDSILKLMCCMISGYDLKLLHEEPKYLV